MARPESFDASRIDRCRCGELVRQPGGADRGPPGSGGDSSSALVGPRCPVGPREGRRVGPRNGVRAGCDSQLSGTGVGGTTGVEQRRVGGVRGDRSGPREAVQRDHQVIDGAGARHVQQAPPLGIAHLLVERLEVFVDLVAMLVRDRPGVAVPHDGVRVGGGGFGGQTRDDGDRELEPFGSVDRHDPDRIVVVFGQDRVGIAALAGHQVDPAEVAPESVSACVAPGAGLIDDVAHAAPHVAAVGAVERCVEQATLVDQRCQQVGWGEPGAAFGQRAEVVERFADGVPGQLLGSVCPDRPGPAPGLPVVQLDIAAPVQRCAQGGHQGKLVGGIVGGP